MEYHYHYETMKKLVLLDANHLMHRAFWAIQRNLSTSSGEQTNAVFGVASMLLTLLQREKPDAVISCFDEGKDTLRHQEHEEYKAGRPETPDEFYTQIPRVHQCLDSFSIPILSDSDYEADDLLATIAVRAVKEGYDVIVVSGDKDLFQLVNGGIQVAVPNGGYSDPEYLDSDGVKKRLGVAPAQVPDYKGLVGDPSDNLKGVRGIGPKTAVKLLGKYKTLEGVYDHISDIKGSTKTKLEEDKESAFFCKRMATLVYDVPVNLNLEETEQCKASLEEVQKFFGELEFYTLKSRLKRLLNEDAFAKEFFTGEFVMDVPEETSKRGAVTEEQLPLLD